MKLRIGVLAFSLLAVTHGATSIGQTINPNIQMQMQNITQQAVRTELQNQANRQANQARNAEARAILSTQSDADRAEMDREMSNARVMARGRTAGEIEAGRVRQKYVDRERSKSQSVQPSSIQRTDAGGTYQAPVAVVGYIPSASELSAIEQHRVEKAQIRQKREAATATANGDCVIKPVMTRADMEKCKNY